MKKLIYSLFALLFLASCTKETNCDCDYLIGKTWQRSDFDELTIEVVNKDSMIFYFAGSGCKRPYSVEQPVDDRMQCFFKVDIGPLPTNCSGLGRADGLRVYNFDCDSETFNNAYDITWYRID